MKKEDLFSEAKKEIESAGLTILEAEYAPHMSGSWHIIVENATLFRLFLDGQASWLVLEEELSGVLNGPRVWKDIWIGQNLDTVTLARGIGILVKKCRGN